MVALLTINSFPFPFPHQISDGLDILWYLIISSHFFSFQTKRGAWNVIIHASKFDKSSWSAQSLPSSTRKPRLYTIYMDYFAVLFYSHRGKEKKGKVTNCGNGSWKSLSSQVQVAHENRDCTQSIWIISAVLFYFHRGKKKGNVTNCGNGSWKSLLSHGLKSCALN